MRRASRNQRKTPASTVRGFLRFAYIRGYLNKNLIQAVPNVTNPFRSQNLRGTSDDRQLRFTYRANPISET